MCIYVCICLERERGRERESQHVYLSMYSYVYNYMYVYMYNLAAKFPGSSPYTCRVLSAVPCRPMPLLGLNHHMVG